MNIDLTVSEMLAKIIAERDHWMSVAAKALAFKQYVHDRLDAEGISVDPDSPHKAEGCRIGGRLDEVFSKMKRGV